MGQEGGPGGRGSIGAMSGLQGHSPGPWLGGRGALPGLGRGARGASWHCTLPLRFMGALVTWASRCQPLPPPLLLLLLLTFLDAWASFSCRTARLRFLVMISLPVNPLLKSLEVKNCNSHQPPKVPWVKFVAEALTQKTSPPLAFPPLHNSFPSSWPAPAPCQLPVSPLEPPAGFPPKLLLPKSKMASVGAYLAEPRQQDQGGPGRARTGPGLTEARTESGHTEVSVCG